jgi:hypothetical protein
MKKAKKKALGAPNRRVVLQMYEYFRIHGQKDTEYNRRRYMAAQRQGSLCP